MSTRSQIIIKDEYDEQWFYRHSDGYPSGNLPQLQKLIKWYHEGLIRRNVEQSAGWLILIGAREYDHDHDFKDGKVIEIPKKDITKPSKDDYSSWKCGSYEISVPREHGDIEYLYTINTKDETLTIKGMYGKERTFSWKEIINMNVKDFVKLDGGL